MSDIPPEGFAGLFKSENISLTFIEGTAPVDTFPLRSGRLYVDISGATSHPEISWMPDESVMGLIVYKVVEMDDFQTIWYISGNFQSPITYGTIPFGASQIMPPMGSPEVLTEGEIYSFLIIHSSPGSPSFLTIRLGDNV